MITAEIRVNGSLIGILRCVRIGALPHTLEKFYDPNAPTERSMYDYHCWFINLDDGQQGESFTVTHDRNDGFAKLLKIALNHISPPEARDE